MGLMRKMPIKLRLPLVHNALWAGAWLRSRTWTGGTPKAGPLVTTAYLHESSGIGQAGRLSIDAFRAAGFDPVEHDITGCYRHCIRRDGTFPVGGDGGVWYIHANAQECLMALLSYPPDQWLGRYRIGYWVWETTRASRLWAWTARFFHEIWVPSRFVRDALAEGFAVAGAAHLAERVRIMPHPLPDLSDIRPDRTRFGLASTAFEVLCLFDARSMAARKNPWAALAAWTRAFPRPVPGINLHLKVQNLNDDATARARLTAEIGERHDITLLTDRLAADAMPSFIASFDAILSLHRSEGFGLTLAEALAMGVTPVATGWSGNMEFMSDANSYPIPSRMVPVSDPSGFYGRPFRREDPNQLWAEPDIDAAATILRSLVRDHEGRAARARAGRASIRELNRPWESGPLRTLPFAHLATSPPCGRETSTDQPGQRRP